MLKGKSLLEYTKLFSPNEHKKNDKVILKYFDRIYKSQNNCNVCNKYRKSKKTRKS